MRYSANAYLMQTNCIFELLMSVTNGLTDTAYYCNVYCACIESTTLEAIYWMLYLTSCMSVIVLGILAVLFVPAWLRFWASIQRWVLCRIMQLSTTKWYAVCRIWINIFIRQHKHTLWNVFCCAFCLSLLLFNMCIHYES